MGVATACNRTTPPEDVMVVDSAPDAPVTETDVPDAAPDAAPVGDAATDADVVTPTEAGLPAPCLDRPTDLPRPPAGALPCELIPPSFR